MKNILKGKFLILLCFLFSYNNNSIARVYGDNYQDCNRNECCQGSYTCGCPLECGTLDFWLLAGVAPTLWTNRGTTFIVSCNAAGAGAPSPVLPLFDIPKFNKLYHVPFMVGGQVGYAITDNVEVYLEGNYRRASARTFTLTGITVPNDSLNLTLELDPYKAFGAFIGARYYFDRMWCDRVSFFLGGQFGLVHRSAIDTENFTLTATIQPGPMPLTLNGSPFFFASTAPASGINFGFDWCMGCGFSAVFMVEIIATCGPNSNDADIPINNGCNLIPALLPSNIVVGNIGTDVSFPIMAGLKYTF